VLAISAEASDCKTYEFTLPDDAIVRDCRQSWANQNERDWIYEGRYRGIIAPFDEKKCIALGVIPKRWDKENKGRVH
jgi:hypothetical protein